MIFLGKIFDIVILFIIISLSFIKLPMSYFEQDEWHSFGHYIYLSSLSTTDFLKNLLPDSLLSHFTPFSLFFKMLLFKMVGLEASYYFFLSIIFHSLIVVSVYYLALFLFKKRLVAIFSALFFGFNSSHHQAVTWIGTFEGSEVSTLFGLLSILSILIYFNKKLSKFLFISLFLIFIGLLFKETALSFYIVLGGLIIFKYMLVHSFKIHPRLIIQLLKNNEFRWYIYVVILYAFLRLLYLFEDRSDLSFISTNDRYNFLHIFLYNLTTLPIKLFSQILIPQKLLVEISDKIVLAFGDHIPVYFGQWKENIALVYDSITISTGFLIIISLFILNKLGKKISRLSIFLCLAVIIPLLSLNKYLVFLDSRYLYPASAGVALLFGNLLDIFLGFGEKCKRKWRIIYSIPVLTAFFFVIFVHFIMLNLIIKEKIQIGQERRLILEQIKSLYPRLSDKTIIYAESDKSYYGLVIRTLPFQSGLGQILLIYYNQLQNFPIEFFQKEFLWDTTSQGYSEKSNLGFGFFWNFDQFAETYKINNLVPESVVGFYYDSKKKLIKDNTQEIRGRLKGFLADKRKIQLNNLSVIVDSDFQNGYSIIDDNIKTAWKSALPYAVPQKIQINLMNEKVVNEIVINSGDDQNQNEVGYKISLSRDGKNWHQVFYAKRYSPGKDGLVKLYFEPTLAKYITIDQVGFHQFASWVIYELEIYEAI